MSNLEQIRQLGQERAALLAREAEIQEELGNLIREDLQGDPPRGHARRLAEASGLSVPRIYQIRDGRR